MKGEPIVRVSANSLDGADFEGYDVRLGYRDVVTGSISVAQPVIMAAHQVGSYVQPMLSVDRVALQQMLDEIWRLGLRPSKNIDTREDERVQWLQAQMVKFIDQATRAKR